MTKLNLSFVFVGSLSVRKAAWDIIQAVKDMPDIDLTLIGDGEQRALIEKGIADYHLRNVKLLGTRNNSEIMQLIADKDVFVMSSHYDGWGAVVNEALTCGLYVICTDRSGARDLLESTQRGMIYHAGDISQLHECVQWCIANAYKIQHSKEERIKWAARSIDGKLLAAYFIDCLQGLKPTKPWLDALV